MPDAAGAPHNGASCPARFCTYTYLDEVRASPIVRPLSQCVRRADVSNDLGRRLLGTTRQASRVTPPSRPQIVQTGRFLLALVRALRD